MLAQKLLHHIAKNYIGEESDDLTIDTLLLDLNIIDSSAFFDIVDFLKRESGIAIPLQDVTPDTFASARSIVDLIIRLQKDRAQAIA